METVETEFSYVGNRTAKRGTGLPTQTHVTIDGSYFTLVDIIHHHGNSANSGHYTCTLFYNDKILHCNVVITESSDSRSVHSSMPNILVKSRRCIYIQTSGGTTFILPIGIIME